MLRGVDDKEFDIFYIYFQINAILYQSRRS